MEPLRPDQQRAAALTLAEAFASDPLLEILAPDPARRVKLGPPMMGVLLAYGMLYGRVWANGDASAPSRLIAQHPAIHPNVAIARMGPNSLWEFFRREKTIVVAMLKVGDRLDMTWTDAVLISVDPARK